MRSDGAVKILDFGLAKALDPSDSGSVVPAAAAITSPAMTHAGAIFGTAAYMSPEQARGKAVDKRTDIWAFGCVLYETLTGRQAFRGETIQDTLAAVLGARAGLEPAAGRHSGGVVRLLRRCLEKNPNRRLHDIADARIEIEDAACSETDRPRRAARPASCFGLWPPWRQSRSSSRSGVRCVRQARLPQRHRR